jgi:uncharacterized protein
MIVPLKQGTMHFASTPQDENYIIGSKCQSCGAMAFPKRVVCHKCYSDKVVEVPLGKKGKLSSYTVAWAAPEGMKPPIVQGYVDLPEGVRILAIISGAEPRIDALKIGQEMELVFEEVNVDKDGNQVVAFKFKPVK